MPYGAPVDVYGFGVTLYELVARQEFFIDCEHDYMIASNVMEGIRPEVPGQCIPEYKALLDSCWGQQAADRYKIVTCCEFTSSVLTRRPKFPAITESLLNFRAMLNLYYPLARLGIYFETLLAKQIALTQIDSIYASRLLVLS